MCLFDIYNAAGHLRDLFCIVMRSPAILATSAPNYLNKYITL